jgi:hypothetical protein
MVLHAHWGCDVPRRRRSPRSSAEASYTEPQIPSARKRRWRSPNSDQFVGERQPLAGQIAPAFAAWGPETDHLGRKDRPYAACCAPLAQVGNPTKTRPWGANMCHLRRTGAPIQCQLRPPGAQWGAVQAHSGTISAPLGCDGRPP